MNEILQQRARFLAFLKARLKDGDLAEEILQAAYLKSLQSASDLRKEESIVAWFYRILRNVLADHYRKARVRRKALEARPPAEATEDPALEKTACRCVSALVPAIKPEYADVIEKVDLAGAPVQEVAVQLGISASNASVRLHRARKALRDQVIRVCGACALHRCVDCSCEGGHK